MESNLALWSGIIGFGMPILIAGLNKEAWPSQAKALVAFAACLVVAAIEVWIKGELSATDYVTAALVILASSITFYKGFWLPTGVAPIIEKRILG